jgi:hypothetical protein
MKMVLVALHSSSSSNLWREERREGREEKRFALKNEKWKYL